MGQCCSTDSKGEGRYVKQELSGSIFPFSAPKQHVQSRESAWQTTGIIGLRDQNLKALPPAISNHELASTARVLDATNNSIRELPASISSLINLQRLVLANNQIAVLPGSLIASLVNLKLLNLDSNRLTQLPDEIQSLTKLEKLSVNSNQLTSLPATLQHCVSLQQLSTRNNRLTGFPQYLPSELEEFDASNNQIKDIPASYGSLVKLKILNCDGNQISCVPEEVLLNCAALHTLSLHANPITPDVLQSNPAFDAFEQRRRSKYNKVIAGGVLMGPKGLDEGVDRKV